MPGRQAKVIAPSALAAMLRHVNKHHPNPTRSRAIILLSVKAGLRAAEIAKLEWPMVLNANGQVGRILEIDDRIAKKGSGRRVPMHSDLLDALVALLKLSEPYGPVILSRRGAAMRPNSIVCWFVSLYQEMGLEGCSSHSGRRTFITNAARLVHKAGGSLRDVQILAGHRSIEMTQRYIDGDSAAQHRLVALL